jgi:hypothetical protein
VDPSFYVRNLWELWHFDPRLKTWMILLPAIAIASYILVYFFYLLIASTPGEGAPGESLHRRAFFPSAMLATLAFLTLRFYLTPSKLSRLSLAVGAIKADKSPDVKVWVNTRSGFYYCPGVNAYGRLKPGVYMNEQEAVEKGYQPSSRRTCPPVAMPAAPKARTVDRMKPSQHRTPPSQAAVSPGWTD